MSRLPRSLGAVWAVPTLVSSAHGCSAQNPVLFQDPGRPNVVHLLHTSHLQDTGQGSSEIHHLQSKDGGVTWGPPHRADAPGLDRPGMFLRAPPLILRGGSGVRILLPVYHTPGGSKTHFSEMLEHVVAPSESGDDSGGSGWMFSAQGSGWTRHAMSRPG